MRHRLTLPLVLAFTVVLGSVAAAANWERFRGPNGTGVATDKNVPVEFSEGNGILWKLKLPGLGNSSPVVWGNHLFLQTATDDGSERFLLCIDVAKGQELWRRGIPGNKAHTHPKNTLASSTPATDGEGVYVAFWDGKEVYLVAYNFKGDVLWNKNLGLWVSQHGTGASPIVYKDKVIFANDMDKEYPADKKDKKAKPKQVTQPSTLFAFYKKTGEKAWEAPREAYRACYSAPFLLENPGQPTELIVTSTTSITSYDPDTGAQNWRWNWNWTGLPMPLRTIGAPVHVDGMLLACSGDGGGARQAAAVALNGSGKKAQPKQMWNNIKDFPYVPCVLNKGQHLFFVNDAGTAACYEIKSGKRLWQERIPDAAFTASPVMIDDKIYAASEQGDVHVFAADPAAFRPLAKNSLGERIRATPAVADGRLYIRTQTTLYCIGKK